MADIYDKQEQAFLSKIGGSIKRHRILCGLSQENFAKVCKLDRTYISAVERGQRNISLLTLRKIAKALKLKPEDLFKNEP